MPTGKVKWYDAEKGFGFLSADDGTEVFLHANALPEGTTTLRGGARVEFGVIAGRKGAQATGLTVLDTPSVAQGQLNKHRKAPEAMVPIVEDLMQLLDGVSNQLRRGRYPDPAMSGKVAQLLRAVASDFDGER